MVLAEHNWKDDGDGQQRFAVDEVVEHPDYAGRPTYDYDFALVRLEVRTARKTMSFFPINIIIIRQKSAPFSMVIRPACLPHPPDRSLPIDPRSTSSYEGYLATIAGWGRTRSSRLSDQLTKVENVQVR